MRHPILTATAAVLCTGALTLAYGSHPSAQLQPQTRPPTAPLPESQATTPRAGAMATLTGCLYRERDVPGRSPNIAERAGVLEDYILTDARPAGSRGEASGLATGRMYKVEKIEDERLRKLVGKRVEVVGRIDAEAGDVQPGGRSAPDRNISRDAIELPEFEASSIREVAGNCPATPSAPPSTTPRSPNP